MSNRRFDLMIVGGGSAGFAAAIKAVELGAKVAMANHGTIGGTCVNVGCVPSKFLLTAGELNFYSPASHFRGVECLMQHNLRALVKQKAELVMELRKKKYADLLDSYGIELFDGRACFRSKNELEVDGEGIEAGKFIIATGARPNIPLIEGIEKVGYLTNVEALELEEQPESLIVVGSGPLGLEFAQMYSHLGTRVTVLERGPTILSGEEPEVSRALKSYLEDEGIEIHTDANANGVKEDGALKVVAVQFGGENFKLRCEALLLATGRRPNTEGLGLERVGVQTNGDGSVVVDEEMRTTAPNIWAVGDVLGGRMIEAAAAKQGAIAAENAIRGSGKRFDGSSVPRAVFTMPQAASVGLTEGELSRRGYSCACRTVDLSNVAKALIVGDTRGLVKINAERNTKKILGVHMVAPLAAEMIHEGALAVKYGLTIDDLIDTVHIFPSMTEALRLAAISFGKDVGRLSCCAE